MLCVGSFDLAKDPVTSPAPSLSLQRVRPDVCVCLRLHPAVLLFRSIQVVTVLNACHDSCNMPLMKSCYILGHFPDIPDVLCEGDLKNLLLLRVVVIICLTPAFLCSRHFLMAIFARIEKSKTTTWIFQCIIEYTPENGCFSGLKCGIQSCCPLPYAYLEQNKV